jgi:hypothetical protein
MRFIVFSVGCQYGCIASAASSARTRKIRVLMAPAKKALLLSEYFRAADGIKAAKLTKQ